MDNIMDNQWNLGLNLTLEEYETDNSTSDDFPSNFDWEFFHERSNFKLMGLQIGKDVFRYGLLTVICSCRGPNNLNLFNTYTNSIQGSI